MERLIEGRTLWKGSFQVVGIHEGPEQNDSSWLASFPPKASYFTLRDYVAPDLKEGDTLTRQFALIDRALDIRGRFPVTKEGGIEAFHRATRLTLSRAAR